METDDNQAPPIISFGGLELEPEEYRNTTPRRDDAPITCRARFIVGPEEHQKIWKMASEWEYFAFQREGIDDEPLEARFGLPHWSEHDEVYKWQLRFFEKRFYEEREKEGRNTIGINTLERRTIVQLWVRIDRLCQMLVDKGVLDEEEIPKAPDKGEAAYSNTLLETVAKVEDLDKYSL